MAIPLSIPQDIVCEIIDKLDNSPDALKTCARVARSFLSPSRKKMFSAIRLTTESTERLLPLLQHNPEISWYISDVTIVYLSPEASNTTLLHILTSLKCLRQLTIELGAWKSFPKFQCALRNLLLSPRFTALAINGGALLPCSLINRLGVKKMRLHGVMVQNSGTMAEEGLEEPSMLETLDLLVWSVPDQRLEPLHLFRNVCGLRELGIRMKWGYEKTLSLGRDIIAKSADSIEHVALYYDSKTYMTPDLSLGEISNLRFLSFSLQYFCSENGESDKFDFDWESILDILNDRYATRNLEELSLVIEFRPEMNWDVIGGLSAWADLDSILGSTASKMRKVYLYVGGGFFDNSIGNERLRMVFDDKFSILRRNGVIISYSCCNSSTIDLYRW